MDEETAENVACDLMEIDSIQKELNRIQNENKKREKPYKDRLKMLIYNIANTCPLIEHVNYKFGGFVFILDSKKRAISDRLRVLLPTSGTVFSPKQYSICKYCQCPHVNG